MASVRIVLRTDKIRKDGKAPLFIRLTHNRKSRYTSLKTLIHPDHWQADQQRVSRKHPHSRRLNARLSGKLAEFEEIAFDLEEGKTELAGDGLRGLLAGSSATCFLDYAFAKARDIAQQGRHTTAEAYRGTYQQFAHWLQEVKGRERLPIGEFSIQLARDFKSYLKGQLGNHPNTIRFKFAALRRAMNLALGEGLITETQNSLRRVLTPGRKQRKVIPSREDIAAVEALELEPGSQLWDVRNLYLFAARMAGMRFGDAIALRWYMLSGEHLQWQAAKTSKQRRLYVPDSVREILDLYREEGAKPEGFIFPFLRGNEQLEGRALRRKIGSWNTRCNQALKAISKRSQLSQTYSFHTSRHFFATEFLRKGGRVEILQEILMHSSITQTMEYVHVSDAEMDAAMGKGNLLLS